MTQRRQDTAYDVLVAYDGSDEGLAAVRYAAQEADRGGMPLRIIHVVPGWAPVGPLTPATSGGLNAAGSEFLAQARFTAADVVRDLEIRTELVDGSRVGWILERLDTASLVVLGRRRESRLDRIWRGGTIDGVASRSPYPVVVVPPAWTPRGADAPVVAAFKAAKHADDLFEAAFARAAALGTAVEVVHAWRLPGVYDDIIAGRVDAEERSQGIDQVIGELLASWRAAFPQMPVHVATVHDSAATALIQSSQRAGHLVLVRPAHGGFAHHLGRTARAVLRFGSCPIEVVAPASGGEPPRPWSLEEKGDLVR